MHDAMEVCMISDGDAMEVCMIRDVRTMDNFIWRRVFRFNAPYLRI